MADVASLLAEFTDALSAGRAPDAVAFVERATSDSDRRELAASIEAVLMLSGADQRQAHVAADTATSAAGLKPELIAAIDDALIVADGWSQAIPRWRERVGLSATELAATAVTASGLTPDQANRSAAERWIAAMESGAKTARDVSGRALRALAEALSVDPAEFAAAGGGDDGFAIAYRDAKDPLDRGDLALELNRIADQLSDAIAADSPPPQDIDQWFSGDAG